MSNLAALQKTQQIPVATVGAPDAPLGHPQCKITVVANVVTVMWHFAKAGQKATGHKHPHDHQTLLAHGAISCVADGVRSTFEAPHVIVVRAGVHHEFEALTDDTTFFCIHALRNGDGVDDVIDPNDLAQPVRPISTAEPKE